MQTVTIQLTTTLEQADASIAVGTGAPFRVVELRLRDATDAVRERQLVRAGCFQQPRTQPRLRSRHARPPRIYRLRRPPRSAVPENLLRGVPAASGHDRQAVLVGLDQRPQQHDLEPGRHARGLHRVQRHGRLPVAEPRLQHDRNPGRVRQRHPGRAEAVRRRPVSHHGPEAAGACPVGVPHAPEARGPDPEQRLLGRHLFLGELRSGGAVLGQRTPRPPGRRFRPASTTR
jgi:hypothetical protein